MVEGACVDFDTALRIESRYLAKLAVGGVAKNLISLFFNRNAIKSGASRPKDVPKWKATKVGILGAGMMGGGIAWANMNRGVSCVLKDISLEKAEAGKAYSAMLPRAAGREMIPLDADQGPPRTYRTSRAATVIIEGGCSRSAIFMAQVTKEAEPMLAAGGSFASNTSTAAYSPVWPGPRAPGRSSSACISSRRVDRMELVEIIKGAKRTSAETLGEGLRLRVADRPRRRSWSTTRAASSPAALQAPSCRKAARCSAEGDSRRGDRNAGAPGGHAGRARWKSSTRPRCRSRCTSWSRPSPTSRPRASRCRRASGQKVIVKMVKELNRPGRAAGGGFLRLSEGRQEDAVAGTGKIFGKPGVSWDLQEMKDRILYRQAIEAARCLEEGVLTTVHDANIGSIYGIGFPAWTGGRAAVHQRGRHWRNSSRAPTSSRRNHGARFSPPKLLRDKAAKGEALA
jgi:3-hydroxyacyl-CoA dehydrogenase/enoyl-CoA hydratase/3-hydroxybutyryl-CoA epimerase